MQQHELARVLALANDFKEGDLAVGGTRDDRERDDARRQLAALRLSALHPQCVVRDGVSDALARSLDLTLEADLSHLTVGALKNLLVGPNGAGWARQNGPGLSSE